MRSNTVYRPKKFSLNIKGELRWFRRPVVMGIINVTDNSFYAQSRVSTSSDIAQRALCMVDQGAEIIDIGACSTAPGCTPVDADTERQLAMMAVRAVKDAAPEVIVSVDTYRADVARAAVAAGADIINDVCGGDGDGAMFDTIAELRVPYVLMHSRGNSLNMQSLTDYPRGVTVGVVEELSVKLRQLRLKGVADVIIDPGFGFAKTVEQNYELLAHLPYIGNMLDAPMLVGMSRKSMIYKPLGITPDDAITGTTVVNTLALEGGAQILRVHDVEAAATAVKLFQLTAERI